MSDDVYVDIVYRLKAVIGGGAGQTGERTDRVELHHFDFRHNAEDAEREAYKVLMAAATAKGGTLHMLMDEVWFTSK
nr:hypothetical protein BaRGS_013536 [Batillaria attramentaria]